MSEKQTTIWELERDVAQEVRESAKEIKSGSYPEDRLHEIADSHVPIYNADRVECLLNDLTLAEPEDAGGVEGVTNIFDILAWTIYERLIVAAHEAWAEVKDNVYITDKVREKDYECEEDDADEFIDRLRHELANWLVEQPEFRLVVSDFEEPMDFDSPEEIDLEIHYKHEIFGTVSVEVDRILDQTAKFSQFIPETQEEILETIVEYITDNDLIERSDE